MFYITRHGDSVSVDCLTGIAFQSVSGKKHAVRRNASPPPGTVRRAAWQPPHDAAGRKFTCSLCRGVVFPDCWRCHDVYVRPCCSFGHRIHFWDERCRRYVCERHASTCVTCRDSFCSAGCWLNHKCLEEQPRRTYVEFPPVCDASGVPIEESF